jgi:DNA-binding transcriptional LysR family regulator
MHLRGLDLNLLVVLHTLLEEKNITRTARRIYLSQSATSGALARLREFFENDLLVQVGHKMVLTPLAESLVEPVRQLLAEAQAIIEQRPDFDPATSTRRFRMMMTDYVTAVLMTQALPAIKSHAPSVGIDILPFEETPPEEVIDRVEVDMVVLPQQFLTSAHPSEELFRDTYTCIVWKGNHEIGKTMSLDEYFATPHVSIRFTTQPTDSLSEWIHHRTGRTRKVDVTTRLYTMIPHLIVNTNRIGTVHQKLANLYAKLLPIRIVEPPFEMPHVAEGLQWHSFRSSDPGIAWMRERLRRAADELSSTLGENGAGSSALRGARTH